MTRYERKFALYFSDYCYLRDRVKTLGEPDYYMKGKPFYPVFTRYYDTEDFRFYDEKANGDFRHTKIRLRQYSRFFDPLSPGFLEAKTKTKEIVRKWRCPVIGAPESGVTRPPNEGQGTNWQAIQFFFERLDLKPSVNVLFDREAYTIYTHSGEAVRISFDSNLRASHPYATNDRQIKATAQAIALKKPIICEIKGLIDHIPDSLKHDFIRANAVQRPFSKYASAIQTIYHLTD